MPGEQPDGEERQRLVDGARAVEEEAVVPLAEPEEEARGDEEDGEGRAEKRVELLACVEAPLRRATPAEPAPVVRVERLDLPPVGGEPPPVSQHDDEDESDHPG